MIHTATATAHRIAAAAAIALLAASSFAQQASAPAAPGSAAGATPRAVASAPATPASAAKPSGPASGARAAALTAAQSTTASVERMLAIDGQQAVAKFLEEAAKAGVTGASASATGSAAATGAGASLKPEPKPEPKWAVRSIFGLGSTLSADISVDGAVTYSVAAGQTVEKCKVLAIADRCVKLEPPLDKKGKPVKGMCPASVCWTGNELTAELRPSQAAPSSPAQAPQTPLPGGGQPPLPPNMQRR